MNKVLQRAMFSIPKHEHKSTGIASGLEYRSGYRVGGRVGFDAGGPVPHAHPHGGTNPLDVNPRFSMGSGIIDTQAVMDLSKQQWKDLYGDIEPMDYMPHARDYSKYQTDYSKYAPSRLGAVGQAAGMTIEEPIPEGQSQWAKFFGNLSRTSGAYKERRDELDMLAEADANKMAMMTDKEASEYKMKTAEAIRASDIAEADKVADLYAANVNAKLAETELGMKGEELKLEKQKISLGQDQLEQAFTLAELDAETRKYVSDNLLKKQPETLQLLGYLTDDMDMSIEEAMGYAFKERNSQLQLAASLLDALVPRGTVRPGERAAAVNQVFTVMQKLFPELLNISQEELLKLLETPDPLSILEE